MPWLADHRGVSALVDCFLRKEFGVLNLMQSLKSSMQNGSELSSIQGSSHASFSNLDFDGALAEIARLGSINKQVSCWLPTALASVFEVVSRFAPQVLSRVSQYSQDSIDSAPQNGGQKQELRCRTVPKSPRMYALRVAVCLLGHPCTGSESGVIDAAKITISYDLVLFPAEEKTCEYICACMQLVEERDSLEDLLLKEQMKTQANAGIVSSKSHQGSLLIILMARHSLGLWLLFSQHSKPFISLGVNDASTMFCQSSLTSALWRLLK
jgi:hypothetical protein